MTADIVLAIAHHMLVLTLAGVIAAELVLARVGMSPAGLKTLATVDMLYGISAGLLVVVGFMRVFMGAKGAAFYLENHVFWTKIAAFAAVGLISIAPTVTIFKWRRRAKADPAQTPSDREIAGVRRFLLAEAAVFATIPIWAALMARGVGLG